MISRFTEEERNLNNTTVTMITAMIRANSENETRVPRFVVSAVQLGATRVRVQLRFSAFIFPFPFPFTNWRVVGLLQAFQWRRGLRINLPSFSSFWCYDLIIIRKKYANKQVFWEKNTSLYILWLKAIITLGVYFNC